MVNTVDRFLALPPDLLEIARWIVIIGDAVFFTLGVVLTLGVLSLWRAAHRAQSRS